MVVMVVLRVQLDHGILLNSAIMVAALYISIVEFADSICDTCMLTTIDHSTTLHSFVGFTGSYLINTQEEICMGHEPR